MKRFAKKTWLVESIIALRRALGGDRIPHGIIVLNRVLSVQKSMSLYAKPL